MAFLLERTVLRGEFWWHLLAAHSGNRQTSMRLEASHLTGEKKLPVW